MVNTKDIFMLCNSCQDEKELANFDRNKWKANTKFDGHRVMAIKKDEDIILFNRNGNIVTRKFKEVAEGMKGLKNCMIDGEIISIDGDFNRLQKRALTKDLGKLAILEKEIPVKLMVFDILVLENKVIRNEPLRQRLIYLRELLKDNKNESIELVEYGEIDEMLIKAIESKGEGIVIKDMEASYEAKRSKNWLKHKLFSETTITITGFTENPAGIRATDDKGNICQIAGHNTIEVLAKMKEQGYCEIRVQYLEKTKENRLRFPSYKGVVKNEF